MPCSTTLWSHHHSLEPFISHYVLLSLCVTLSFLSSWLIVHRYCEVIDDCQAALILDPTLDKLILRSGRARLKLGHFQEAESAFLQLLRQSRVTVSPTMSMSIIMMMMMLILNLHAHTVHIFWRRKLLMPWNNCALHVSCRRRWFDVTQWAVSTVLSSLLRNLCGTVLIQDLP